MPSSRSRARASARSVSTRASCSTPRPRTRTPRCRASRIACTSRRARRRSKISCCSRAAIFTSRSLLDESARILRDTRYLRDALIRPVAYHDGVVDIEVTTQDVWTFNPGISFGRKGGENSSGVELEELNFLGTGTQLGVGFKSDVDRDSKFVHYRDRQLGSSWWDCRTTYSDNSDGRLAEFSLEHPFYALGSRWAGGVSLLDDQRTDSRYDLGEIVDQYATHEKRATIYWGPPAGCVDGWARRCPVGLTYDDHAFGAVPWR